MFKRKFTLLLKYKKCKVDEDQELQEAEQSRQEVLKLVDLFYFLPRFNKILFECLSINGWYIV